MKHQLTHMEALANTIVGVVLAQLVLWMFDVEFKEALALNATMLGASYIRSYLIRRLFIRLEE